MAKRTNKENDLLDNGPIYSILFRKVSQCYVSSRFEKLLLGIFQQLKMNNIGNKNHEFDMI